MLELLRSALTRSRLPLVNVAPSLTQVSVVRMFTA